MRLRIWRATTLVADAATGTTGVIDRDMALLYEREAPRLRRRLACRVSPDKAADLVQAAFARMLGLGSDRIGQLGQREAYLNRIAENLANDDARAVSRRGERLHLDIDDCDVAGGDPHAALEARDMLRRIEAAIPLLPARTREIFMAHRFEDLTYPEIAERLGLSVKTIEKHISLALRELHRSLGSAQ